jgi:DNA-binding GntR family transcriptional regulator
METMMNGATAAPREHRTNRKLQSERVYEQLRRDIAAQRLAPDTVLHEAELGESYNASRTPVREALFRLQEDGFLYKVGRHLRVRSFCYADVEELYQMREALEKMAARLCIERAGDAELAEVERQLEAYGDFDAVTDYDALNQHANQFHRTIARLSGNHTIFKALESFHDKALVLNFRYWTQEHSWQDAQREHGMILHAIQARDVTLAEAAVRHHIQGVLTLYRRSNGPVSK